MEFWGHLYRELKAAAGDMRFEDLTAHIHLEALADHAANVFDDWRDLGAIDACTLNSRRYYGSRKRSSCSTTRGIVELAEAKARQDAIKFYNQ